MRLAAAILVVLAVAVSADAAPRSGSALYFRGTKDLGAVLEIEGADLAARTREGPPLLVLLVDPGWRSIRAYRAATAALASVRERLGEGAQVVVGVVGEAPPVIHKFQVDPQIEPVRGIRNLLGSVRRAVKVYRRWKGPKHLLLVAADGAEGEEETEGTLAMLRRAGIRLSVVTGEAAFARPWRETPPRPAGFLVRSTGHPDDRRDTMYAACDTAFPEQPGAFELDLAPGGFRWTPAGKRLPDTFFLPSGFGYYHLARLCAETGGRYYLHSFGAPGGGIGIVYDYSVLGLFAPDLRSRAAILSDLGRCPEARALFRAWEALAKPSCGGVRRRPPVRLVKGRPRMDEEGTVKPNRGLRLDFQGRGDAMAGLDLVRERIGDVEGALDLVEKARRGEHGKKARPATAHRRWRAHLDLMNLQLMRLRFHLVEMERTLEDLEDEDIRNETIHLRPAPIAVGSELRPGVQFPEDWADFLREVLAESKRMEEAYAGTPWGYAASLGELVSFRVFTRKKGESRPVARTGEGTRPQPRRPKPGRPSSSGSGAATGGD
jgi:hypothetical protein